MGLTLARRVALPFFALIVLFFLAHGMPIAHAQSNSSCVPNGYGNSTECDAATPTTPITLGYNSPNISGTFADEGALVDALRGWGSGYCTFNVTSGPTWGPPNLTFMKAIYYGTMGYSGTSGMCGVNETPFSGTAYFNKQVPLTCPAGSLWSNGAGWPLGFCWIYVVQLDQTQKTCPFCVANPIYPGTGNKRQEEVDYTGTGPIPLEFHRVYNSGSQYFTRSVPTGTQWRTTWSRWITYYSTSSGTEIATINRPEGSYSFTLTGSNWVPDADVNYKLTGSPGTFKVTSPDGRDVEFYRGDGQLSTVKTVSGTVKYTLTYNSATPALLTQVSDPFGHTLTFTYDTQQRLATLTDPNGKVYQYGYDANSNLTTVTYPDATVRTYVYNESGYTSGTSLPAALTGIVDESNTRFANFGYTSTGLAVLSEHAGGADRYSVSYGSPPQFCPPSTTVIDTTHHIKYLQTCWIPPTSAAVTDPLGTVRNYGFTSIWGGVSVTGSDQPCAEELCTPVPAAQSFDANGNVSSETDFNGNVTTRVFDLTRNVETSRTEAYGTSTARTITTSWNASFRLPGTVTEANRTTAYTYDANGNVLTKTITDTTVSPHPTRTWTYTYDSYNRVLTLNGPRTDVSDVTTYVYYSCTTGSQCGQLQTVTNAKGYVTTYNTYDKNGRPLTITDPNGTVTTLSYDTRGRLTSRQIGAETTTLSYWPTGLLKQVTLPDSSYMLYSYDAAHRLTQISDGLGNAIDYTLDAMGNRTAESIYDVSSTLRRTHSRVFNGLNQLYKDVNAAGTAAVTTTFGYDANGNQTSVAAPLSRSTADTYDALNRLKQITDPASGVAQLTYDGNDNLTSVTDPRSLTTSYTYSGFGDLATQVRPDSGTTTNTYDSGGNLATSTDARGATSTYSYDALNRATSVAYKIGGAIDQTITFTYDAGTNGKGHLTGASDANHSMSWSYDSRGRVTSKSQIVGGVTLSVAYGYTNSDLTSVTTPSGQSVTYGYNANHQMTSVSVNGVTVLNNATYEPLGPVNGWTWGNSTTVSRTYDTDGKISAISSAGTKTYSYDDAFRITSISDTSAGASNWAYGYDTLDRISSGSSSGGVTRGWTYDASGNRLTESGSASSTYSISSSSNQITGITGALARTFSYDAAGNTLSYSSVTATYTDAGRLRTIVQGGATETLSYNALGQRIETSGGAAGTVLYAYDEGGHLVGEYDGTGALIEETVWLGDIPVATLRPNGSSGVDVFYVHTDQLNTPRAVTRPSDNMVMWSWYSDPFGTDAANETPAGAGTFKYNLRFAGQVFDGQAGLHANGFRDCYDPAIGRYCEPDPIGLAGGSLSLYAYVGGNPISFVDPFGLFLFPWESPVSVVGGTKEQQDAISAAIDRIFKTPRGQEMESQIRGPWYWHGSPKTLHVNCAMNDAGEVGGNNLFIDPTWNPDIMTPFGLRPAALDRIIAHELGHTLGTSDNGPDRMNNVRLNENPVAIALGEPVRIQY
jgi:RHS repeat-associated protein